MMGEENLFKEYLASSQSSSYKTSLAPSKEVQDLVDAVSGATWQTRNQILEQRFLHQLDSEEADVPSFRPPGVVE